MADACGKAYPLARCCTAAPLLLNHSCHPGAVDQLFAWLISIGCQSVPRSLRCGARGQSNGVAEARLLYRVSCRRGPTAGLSESPLSRLWFPVCDRPRSRYQRCHVWSCLSNTALLCASNQRWTMPSSSLTASNRALRTLSEVQLCCHYRAEHASSLSAMPQLPTTLCLLTPPPFLLYSASKGAPFPFLSIVSP
jgi:hypothetical protein